MSTGACLVGIAIVMLLFVVFFLIANFTRTQSSIPLREPIIMAPPTQITTPLLQRPTTTIPSAPEMIIKAWRTPTVEGFTSSPNTINFVNIPLNVTIYFNQKTCKVCHNSILSSASGWKRCMHSKKLVHGECHEYIQKSHPGITNWCTVCEGSCGSGQAMGTEGIRP